MSDSEEEFPQDIPSSSIFVKSVSDEKKRMQTYKYSIYIKSTQTTWTTLVLNAGSSSTKSLYSGTSSNSNIDRMNLMGIVQGIKNILAPFSPEEHRHIKIYCYTSSIYCWNVCKEWIHVWKKNRCISRPNIDLLQQLVEYMDCCNIDVVYTQYYTGQINKDLEQEA